MVMSISLTIRNFISTSSFRPSRLAMFRAYTKNTPVFVAKAGSMSRAYTGNCTAVVVAKDGSLLPERTKILKEEYTLGRMLGKGAFEKTYVCTHNATGELFACKSITKKGGFSQNDYKRIENEIEVMKKLLEEGHSGVVQIHEAFFEENAYAAHIIMELCEGGDLLARIKRNGYLGEGESARLMKTIVNCIDGCHNRYVIHRDVKPQNILFVSNAHDAPLKLADLGSSTFYKPGQIFSEFVGTPAYMAPEVWQGHYGPAADMWSTGGTLYSLLSGMLPFRNGRLDFESDPWPSISESAKDLIQKMLDKNPKKVLCHPWIVQNNIA